MQRRPGSSSKAHIASPTFGAAPDADKGSRLSQRNLRTWAVLLGCFLVLGLIHYVLNDSPTVLSPYSNANLKAKNYLNSSAAEPNPFPFCPPNGPGDPLKDKYSAQTLAQSRLHHGSGARIQRLLTRALAGHPVTISVVGGSVSACHGAGDDPISPKCYPSRFFSWWNTVFPHPASELTNGAMRRTSSSYFGYCSMHHIPDVSDLIIIELDTDDGPGSDSIEHFETLVRSLLNRADEPAVLLLGHFSPQLYDTHGFTGPEHQHSIVAQFYDVPHISTRSALLTDYMHDPTSIKKYYVDPVLASPLGHELITDILIAYFQTQICSTWGVATGSSLESAPSRQEAGDSPGLFGGVGIRKGVPEPKKDDEDETKDVRVKPDQPPANVHRAQARVPPRRMKNHPNAGRPFEEIMPYCVSANDLINPLPPSLFYGSGWFAHHPSTGSNALQVTSHYWYSTLPTSKLRIPIVVGAGDVGIYYLQEPISAIGEGSSVHCWVDDNYAGAKVIENSASVNEPIAALMIIDQFVSRGNHFIECRLQGEEGQGVPMFKIIGIFAT